MKRLLAPLLLLFLVFASVFLVYYGWGYFRERGDTDLLQVSFLSVGQGDATFIESPTGIQVLIDGGRDTAVLERLSGVMGYFDRSIDMIVATHPDSDHIGGLIHVLKRYQVKSILMTNNINDTPAYEAFMDAVEKEDAQIIFVKRGDVFEFGAEGAGTTTLSILFPDRDMEKAESNLSSIVAKLSYGDADFLFTGDSPSSIETYLVGLDGSQLQSEILKVGHHGSRTSTDPLFLSAVSPLYGIVSSGKDNDYGHPHREVVEALSDASVITKNTADEGSILFETDGSSIWLR